MKTKSSAQAVVLSRKSLLATFATTMVLLVAAMIAAPLVYAQADVIPTTTSQVAAADTTPPSDVEGVTATAGNGEITLKWDTSTDTVGVKGYKIYYGAKPVVSDGDTYDLGPADAGNKLTYTIQGLNNGTTYYFAVTAYDAAGNESENYSVEVSATPSATAEHAAADTVAPKVVKAEAVNSQTVKVVFSEAVTLPTLSPEAAFTIKNDTTQAVLEVRKAVKDTSDTTGKTLLLTTAEQEKGTNYIVTAGLQVKDLAGNPLVSGTSDTAVFPGSDVEPAVATQQTQAAADTTGPELVSVSAPDSTHLVITFNEAVKLSATATDNFVITEENSADNILTIKSATLGVDEKTVNLTTDPQKPMNYNLYVMDVTDKVGNLISVDNNGSVFFGGLDGETQASTQQTQAGTQETQVVAGAPEEASQLVASMVGKALVKLVWKASPNTAGNLASYMLYKGTDGTTYGPGTVLASTATSTELNNLVPGVKYFFKLTAKDSAGTESTGITTTFMLPGTGPELLPLLLGSLGLGKLLKRRKGGGGSKRDGGGCGGGCKRTTGEQSAIK
jgi:hypothetical protein